MHDTLLNAIIILQFTCIFLIWQSEWGCAISIKENSSLRQHDLLSLHGLGKIFTSPYKNWSPVPEIAFYLFIEDQIFASQEIWWVKLTPLWVTFSLPISCKQFKIPSVSETILTLFSLFFGGPRLRHSSRFIQHSKTVQFPKSDQGWVRDFTGEADSITGQLLVTYLLHTVQDPFCTATQFSFENSFHTPLFVFWWTKS